MGPRAYALRRERSRRQAAAALSLIARHTTAAGSVPLVHKRGSLPSSSPASCATGRASQRRCREDTCFSSGAGAPRALGETLAPFLMRRARMPSLRPPRRAGGPWSQEVVRKFPQIASGWSLANRRRGRRPLRASTQMSMPYTTGCTAAPVYRSPPALSQVVDDRENQRDYGQRGCSNSRCVPAPHLRVRHTPGA